MLNLMRRIANGQRIRAAAVRVLILSAAWAITTARAVHAAWSTHLLPVLAQAQKTAAAEPAAETGSWPILDWLIVGALICAALYVICRSSRRN
ncbi:MAG TPA: hypothetical protein VGP76_21675 [Planctomycetaceae bacterium]|jgi:hypothetical protein|nr:hypothetical protein [Planctomycetaceae bacterium]